MIILPQVPQGMTWGLEALRYKASPEVPGITGACPLHMSFLWRGGGMSWRSRTDSKNRSVQCPVLGFMCHIPPRGRHAHLPQTGLAALRAVPSSCYTVVCRRRMWLCPRCVLSCDLPGMAQSPPLWEIPSATNLSHTFPLKTAEQDYPTLFLPLFPASSLPL